MKRIRTLTCVAALFTGCLGATAPALAADGMLYEVTEAVKYNSKGGGFKSSTATLAGDLTAGTPLCPTWLATQYNATSCGIIVNATGHADDVTGIGPVHGDFYVVVQDNNQTDPPEITVVRGTLSGTIDLSYPFQQNIPIGWILGNFNATGVVGGPMAGFVANGDYGGIFRLPFPYGTKKIPSYMMNDGRIVPVLAREFSLNSAMVRLELYFNIKK